MSRITAPIKLLECGESPLKQELCEFLNLKSYSKMLEAGSLLNCSSKGSSLRGRKNMGCHHEC